MNSVVPQVQGAGPDQPWICAKVEEWLLLRVETGRGRSVCTGQQVYSGCLGYLRSVWGCN